MTTTLLILLAVLLTAGLAGMIGRVACGDPLAAVWCVCGGAAELMRLLGVLLAAVVKANSGE